MKTINKKNMQKHNKSFTGRAIRSGRVGRTGLTFLQAKKRFFDGLPNLAAIR